MMVEARRTRLPVIVLLAPPGQGDEQDDRDDRGVARIRRDTS